MSPLKAKTHPPTIKLADDRLTFTFPEIAGQLRAHVERQIGHILTGAQRHIEKMSS